MKTVLADPAVRSLLVTIALGMAAVAMTWLRQHLNFIKDAKLKELAGQALDDVDGLARQAAGFAYHWAATSGTPLNTSAGRGAAQEAAINFALQFGEKLLGDTGVLRADMIEKIKAELGVLLASDPNVSVTPPPSPPSSATGALTQ